MFPDGKYAKTRGIAPTALPSPGKESVHNTPMVETCVENSKLSRRLYDVSILQRCLSCILQVFKLFGFRTEGYHLKLTLQHWMNLCDEVGTADAWIRVSKYKLDAFFSAWTGQPLRPPPFKMPDKPTVLLGGSAHRWMRGLLQTDQFWPFVTSILYSKKGFPRPPASAIAAAEIKTKKALTRQRDVPYSVILRPLPKQWADVVETPEPAWKKVWMNLDTAKAELRRTVSELFGKATYSIQDRLRPFFPSTSANYNNSRSRLGAVGSILEDEDLLLGLRTSEELVKFKMQEDNDNTQPGNHVKIPVWDVNTTDLEDRFAKYYWRLLSKAEGEMPIVEPLGLPEALKVRVISKGPPLTYTALKPLQAKMWSVLADHPAFILVGTPVTADIVCKRLGRKLLDGWGYLSGDYQSATDELHSWVSEEIALQIAVELNLSSVERRLLVRALTQHVFLGENGEFLPQSTGQLMGSIASFPILCIANAAACRFAYEQTVGRRTSLRQLPALFNGDDVVMKIPAHGYQLWSRVTGFYGLTESVGKTYFSPLFLNVNSTTYLRTPEGDERSIVRQINSVKLAAAELLPRDAFGVYTGDYVSVPSRIKAGQQYQTRYYSKRDSQRWDSEHFVVREPGLPFPPDVAQLLSTPVPEGPCFTHVEYVNMGLFMGMKRSGLTVGIRDAVSDGPGQSIGARARELYETAPPGIRDVVMSWFVREHSALLRKFRVPWFVSERYGGLGLPPYFRPDTGEYQGPTEWEMRRVASIHRNPEHYRVMSTAKLSWRTHQLAMSRFPVEPIPSEDEALVRKTDEVYAALCVSLLFDSRVGPEDLFVSSDRPRELVALRRNEKLWGSVRPASFADTTVALRRLAVEPRQRLGLSMALGTIVTRVVKPSPLT
jgi:hypothetical protein